MNSTLLRESTSSNHARNFATRFAFEGAVGDVLRNYLSRDASGAAIASDCSSNPLRIDQQRSRTRTRAAAVPSAPTESGYRPITDHRSRAHAARRTDRP